MLACALLGVMVAGQTRAVDLRYQNSGDWFDTVAVTGSYGWRAGGGGPDGLPGENDTARLNWGGMVGNTVTLSAEAPLINRFQFGVDESGFLIVNAGGILRTRGGANSMVGNNNANCIGRMTVNSGGQVIVTNVLFVGNNTSGFVTNDGGNILVTSHLWVGNAASVVGAVYIKNSGVVNVGGNIGLGTINASTASGGKGLVFVQDGGVLNLAQISPVTSIQPNSVLDISGSGVVTIPGDRTADMNAYTNAGRITAYGGTGTVGIDYDTLNAGKTTLFAIVGEIPQTETVWNPAANPSGTGNWNERDNWTGSARPASITKVTFNVPGAIPCTVTTPAVADSVVMGDKGPGGTLIVTNGGSLTCGADNASVLGYNSNAVMVVEPGGSAVFGGQLRIGLDPESDGTLVMNGGTVLVSGMFDLGAQGGKGNAQIKGGVLNLAQWDDSYSIQGASVLDVTGAGQVVINGNHQFSVEFFVSTGQITNSAGTGVVVDYNSIHLGKTTIYPAGVYIAPEQVAWNPALNFPDVEGLWNVSSNWSGGVLPGNVTEVRFNVPDAIPCTVNTAALAKVVRLGLNGPGGTLIITNGGNLTCTGADDWNSIGMNNTGLMVVENGGTASFGNHLWIGYNAGAEGTLIMNGGTVSVGQMFGLGWGGGKGIAQINGGTLNLSQLNPTESIKGESVLNITGAGKVVINGDQVTVIGNYVSGGKITANGGPDVFYFYDAGANKTYVSAVLLPAPQQSITAVSVSDGSVSVTYQTTRQHTYHIEGTPSLSPPSWTPVPGSTNVATGGPVTFTFPASGGQMFYRTVSP